ncbi:TonB family C-terminal domain-containing protein [Mucilaginibacter pineti]|uniref:TonB family C-terminal domain-containing protein n=1 Tax=Mucilaginibacter pineti TaxID=1391627 RepID=A0A1G7DSZ0_9SPHI|nr:energy transducer TonB [Mucilaginibacter pineti]SDE54276.1 TonB family C-terminal domain-containing protein [Mucilaginibacter pineti]
MKLLLTLSLIFIGSLCLAQQGQNVYYIKNNGKYVDVRDSADYVRIVREPDSGTVLYNVTELYINGKRKLLGQSKSIVSALYEGTCRTFYANGQRESIASYKDGEKNGEDFEYYPNGELYLQKTYQNNTTIDVRNDYQIKNNNDSLGKAQVTDGNGYFKGYDDKFAYIEEEGPVKDGKRDGTWKGEFKDIHTSFTEIYDNGKLVNGTAIEKNGKSSNYSGTRRKVPEFKGGVKAFGSFLSRHINYPARARENNVEGSVILSFIVEKTGELSGIKVAKSVSAELDAEAVRVLKKSPLWTPGTQFGNPVRVSYSIPISFILN